MLRWASPLRQIKAVHLPRSAGLAAHSQLVHHCTFCDARRPIQEGMKAVQQWPGGEDRAETLD